MRGFLRRIGAFFLVTPFVALFLAMFLGPPLMVVLETIDMVRMRAQAVGTIDNVAFEAGSKGTSRAKISYHFEVAGRRVMSDRYVPGYMGNSGTYSGGASVARDFPVGRQVTVFYSARDPERCAREYGWFCWSIALTMLWIGAAVLLGAAASSKSGFGMTCLCYAGWGCVVYGFGLMFLGPSVVRVSDLHWHLLAWLASAAVAYVYSELRRRTAPKAHWRWRPDAGVTKERDEVSLEPTVNLVLGVVFATGWTLAVTIPGARFLFSNGIPRWNFPALLLLAVIVFLACMGSRIVWLLARELYRRFHGQHPSPDSETESFSDE